MLGKRKLVLDTFCEVYNLLEPWADQSFWDFKSHELVSDAVYLLSRQQYIENADRIRSIVENDQARIILSNPAEGSETLKKHCTYQYSIDDLIKSKRMLLISGGDMDSEWPCLQFDSFLPKILDYDENVKAITRSDEIFNTSVKPYKFLFLNGRARPHRKYLIDQFEKSGLLARAIWTCLDSTMTGQVKLLESQYEHEYHRGALQSELGTGFVKHQLFNHKWGDVLLVADCYIDTYFSVITETVFDYPYSFRTEKTWKPIAMGHPWITVANQGHYKDLHNLGFKSFGNLIDESFDQIQNNQDRLERVTQVIEDLCQQDLPSFLQAAQQTCKYNQQHLAEMRQQVRAEFPNKFFQYITQYQFNE
jgi:hypothetical protein